MKKFFYIVVLFVFFYTPSFSQSISVEKIEWKGKQLEIVEGEFVFRLKDTRNSTRFDNLLDNFDGILFLKEKIDENNVGLIKFTEKADYPSDIAILEKSGIFEFVYPNTIDRAFVIPDDDNVSNQYALTNLDLYQAWEISKGNSSIKIGILDTGIPIQNGSLLHSDLNDNSRYLFGADIVNDGNGVKDENGHGTHVSGIVGALTNNSNGIAGSNWFSNLYICQVFDSQGFGSAYTFYHGVKDAVDNGCKVINYSGGGPSNPLQENAIVYARNHNVLLVVAAGNNNGGAVEYPGAYANQYDNLVCVSATDENDKFASFSSQGSTVTVSAPGDNIYSTMPNYSVYLKGEGYSQNYDNMDGTSMATPYVTGVASLVFSQNPNYSPAQVKQVLIESSDDIQYYENGFPIWPFDNWEVGVGRDDYTGYGRVNAFKAVSV